jgi:ABC-type transporter Mla maintaining outer membrane lipid asymmetry ATPase subunit MlaF
MNTDAIHIDNLTRTFGNIRAVDQVSLSVPQGTVYGFLGPNGAGKTTTIAMLLGLLRPSAGHIQVFGETVTLTHTAPLRQVGSLVGTPGVEPHLSARDNLRLLSYLHPAVDRRVVESLLTSLLGSLGSPTLARLTLLLPSGLASSLMQANQMTAATTTATPSATGGPGGMATADPWLAMAGLMFWTLALLLPAFWLFRNQDLSGS